MDDRKITLGDITYNAGLFGGLVVIDGVTAGTHSYNKEGFYAYILTNRPGGCDPVWGNTQGELLDAIRARIAGVKTRELGIREVA